MRLCYAILPLVRVSEPLNTQPLASADGDGPVWALSLLDGVFIGELITSVGYIGVSFFAMYWKAEISLFADPPMGTRPMALMLDGFS